MTSGCPDTLRHRPVVGGVSVAASRFVSTGTIHAGTLGAIVTDSADPQISYGLSNFHVLCVDDQRQVGDEIVQPEPSVLSVIPGDRIGTLHSWSFPETTTDGLVDAAICDLEVASLQEVADLGAISGTVAASLGMPELGSIALWVSPRVLWGRADLPPRHPRWYRRRRGQLDLPGRRRLFYTRK